MDIDLADNIFVCLMRDALIEAPDDQLELLDLFLHLEDLALKLADLGNAPLVQISEVLVLGVPLGLAPQPLQVSQVAFL